MKVSRARIMLLFASETGQAKAIAEDIYDKCLNAKLSCLLRCVSEIDNSVDLSQEPCVVLVGSTTGDGDPPETAQKFWRTLHKKDLPRDHFSRMHYTVLGLGDTNYTNFCNFGKTVDARLESLGAKRFYECGWADDGTGLEEVVEPWTEGLLQSLQKHLMNVSSDSAASEELCSASMRTNQEDANQILDNNRKEEVENNHIGVQSNSAYNHLDDKKSKIFFDDLGILENSCILNLPVVALSFSPESKLSLPVLPQPYLDISYSQEDYSDCDNLVRSPLPSATSDPVKCHIESSRVLTENDAVKTTLEITLKFPQENLLGFEPGDSFGVIAPNDAREVDLLIWLLGLEDVANKKFLLAISPSTKKKAAAIPSHIPAEASLRAAFTYCLDIRAVPKKPFIRVLVEYTSDEQQKRRLKELVSKEGMQEYGKCIRDAMVSFLDLLLLFPSCKPPVTAVLEHLPRLLPRPYSAASSSLREPGQVSFVYNLIDIPREGSIVFGRKGVCSGYLTRIGSKLSGIEMELSDQMKGLSLKEDVVYIYLRNNQSFRLPDDLKTPIIMVGPGTGVAPFVGFLQHLEAKSEQDPTLQLGESWLFFGCRHKDKDNIFKTELKEFTEKKILNQLCVCYSRDPKEAGSKYVQDNIILYGDKVSSLIVDKGAMIYVCGDAKNMAKDVLDSFATVLEKHKSFSNHEARNHLAQMQVKKKYLQDVWS
ncbi:methionine synthase reductase-like [Oratosquilla oratoria]|uniref:methionine synthase reductase-like n=1 Tax=Oratosquilla oratoria TaxID=337810 RepID=UPI003F76B3CD